MKYSKISIVLFVLLIALPVRSQTVDESQLQSLWSVRLADNFLRLHPDTIMYDNEAKSRKWNYEQGLMLMAIHQLYKNYRVQKYLDYVIKQLDLYIDNDGNIKTYDPEEFNIDNVTPGKAVLILYKETKLEKYKKAADKIHEQLRHHPRTTEGGFWHKKIYPNQMWLDGLFMGEPFYAKYCNIFGDTAGFDDVVKQFQLINKHNRDSVSGLYYHGWDESRQQKWADSIKGTSPNFWGRAMGWYMMAIVEVLDYLPQNHPGRKVLIQTLNDLSAALMKYRDPKEKLWYQVVDKLDLQGNYLEASASMMYIYAFAKGVNKGYLPYRYYKYAEESFQSAVKNFITIDAYSVISVNHICKVAGLGGSPYRDGSVQYYLSEPQRSNDFKGYGPFILAAVEIEKAQRLHEKLIGAGKVVGLDYYFNNEYKDSHRYHYVWEDTTFSGYSEIGRLIESMGAKKTSLPTAPTADELKKLSMYIIVDPDTPSESPDPHFIDDANIANIVKWVNDGGVLLLLANDSANCEFTHLNNLAEKFGIHFNGDSENKVIGKNFDMGKIDSLPNHPIFTGVRQLYLKEISTMKLFNYAESILRRGNKSLMANVSYGKGFVFALGDPWFYNEYYDNRKLPVEFENYKAAKNLFLWLFEKCEPAY